MLGLIPSGRERRLTRKLEIFAQEFVREGSAKGAYRIAWRIPVEVELTDKERRRALRMPKLKPVAERIATLKAQSLARCQVTVDRIVAEYAKIAFIDPAELFDPAGNVRPIQDMRQDTRAAIASIEQEEITLGEGVKIGTLKKIKLHDKLKALDGLARYAKIGGEDQSGGRIKIEILSAVSGVAAASGARVSIEGVTGNAGAGNAGITGE